MNFLFILGSLGVILMLMPLLALILLSIPGVVSSFDARNLLRDSFREWGL